MGATLAAQRKRAEADCKKNEQGKVDSPGRFHGVILIRSQGDLPDDIFGLSAGCQGQTPILIPTLQPSAGLSVPETVYG